MSRISHLALAGALLFASARAVAWEPEVVGLDDAAVPAAQLQTGAEGAPSALAWAPEIVGLDDAASAGAFLSLEPVDAVALVTPELVGPGPDSATLAISAASTAAGAGAGGR